MSTAFNFRDHSADPAATCLHLQAPGFPASRHPAEPDLFCRQAAMPGHDQGRLEAAHVAIVGCGGLGCWTALAMARMGVRQLTLVDPDRFDRTNAPRQLLFGDDLGHFKAHALARNLMPHMVNPGTLTAMPLPFGEIADDLSGVHVLLVGVDNNRTRLETMRWGLERGVPIVFAMLSRDGLRAEIFLQRPGGPCLLCVLPNLQADSSAPCAAASIASCQLATAHVVHLTIVALTGSVIHPTWRETSLDGSTERASFPGRRIICAFCSTPLNPRP